MSFKEVKELRKNGQLDEATNMARADIARFRDKWSCSALFWCLYDLTKSASSDSLPQLAEEMRSLVADIGDDEVARKCMKKVENQLIPHADEIMQADADSKNPELAGKAYDTIYAFYKCGELSPSFYTSFGWVIYRALKADKSENVEYRKQLLYTYICLNLDTPSLLHSCILKEAVRVEDKWPQQFLFSKFIELWNLDNLQPNDWEKVESQDKKLYNSLVENMTSVYAKEVNSVESVHPSDKFMAVLDKAIDKWPNDDNLIRRKAVILKKDGRNKEAADMYRKAILTSGRKYYLWTELSEIVDDADLQIALLSKALMLRPQEEYICKCRIKLAELLCSNGAYANALYEIEKAKETYVAHGWRIPAQIDTILRAIEPGVAPIDNSKQYSLWSKRADEYLYADFPSVQMVKIGEREELIEKDGCKPQRIVKWRFIDSNNNCIGGIKPKVFNLKNAKIGDCFDVKVAEGRPVCITPVSSDEVKWRKVVHGVVKVRKDKNDKPYTFIDGAYAGHNLLGAISDGEHVEGIAICFGGKWRCISIRVESI